MSHPHTIDLVALATKVINFANAFATFARRGFPRRTPEQIIDIFETHCIGCEHFRLTICGHKNCGCNVNDENHFFNKIGWATEHCPIGKW